MNQENGSHYEYVTVLQIVVMIKNMVKTVLVVAENSELPNISLVAFQ